MQTHTHSNYVKRTVYSSGRKERVETDVGVSFNYSTDMRYVGYYQNNPECLDGNKAGQLCWQYTLYD